MEEWDRALDEVAARLRAARRVLFVTGAGISADSGLPTYRGVGGLYDGRRTVEGYTIEEALSAPVFTRRPDITWKYLAQIEGNCRGARPNRAHEFLAEVERRTGYALVFTQNIDGLHRQAGSREVVEIHGNLRRVFCMDCRWSAQLPDYSGIDIPPSCPHCGGMVRPDVVLFGEALPMRELRRLEAAAERGFDLVFSIGTSSRFPYVVAPVLWARQSGVPTVEINPDRTELSAAVDYWIPMGAAAAMEGLTARLEG